MKNQKRPQRAKLILGNDSKAGCLATPNFKLYYKAIVMNMALCWNKNSYMDQWNRKKDIDVGREMAYSKALLGKLIICLWKIKPDIFLSSNTTLKENGSQF